MKILTISAQKPDSTGSGVFLAQTARRFKEAGHEVAVVCGVAPDDDPAASLAPGIEVHPVTFETDELPFPVCGMSDVMPYRATRYRDLSSEMAERFKSAFARVIDEADACFGPDLVICHHLYLATAVARQVLAHRRVCAVCHSTDLRQYAQHALERPFIARQVRALDRILALHHAQAEEIEELFDVPASQVSLIGTGYDAEVFNRGDGRPPRAPSEPARLLYVGKIGLAKGVESLLSATDLLAADGAAFSLDLVGGHSDEGEYRRIRARAARCAVEPRFLAQLNQRKPSSMEAMARLWYTANGGSESTDWRQRASRHYDRSRYHLLNLHAAFSTERPAHTIEFRAFNGTLDPDKILAYIQLCLAISAQALTSKAASPTRPVTDNPKYTFRCWLLRLGFIGDEFATAREHLLKLLPGDAAWRRAS